jgi:hypothetical protein
LIISADGEMTEHAPAAFVSTKDGANDLIVVASDKAEPAIPPEIDSNPFLGVRFL